MYHTAQQRKGQQDLQPIRKNERQMQENQEDHRERTLVVDDLLHQWGFHDFLMDLFKFGLCSLANGFVTKITGEHFINEIPNASFLNVKRVHIGRDDEGGWHRNTILHQIPALKSLCRPRRALLPRRWQGGNPSWSWSRWDCTRISCWTCPWCQAWSPPNPNPGAKHGVGRPSTASPCLERPALHKINTACHGFNRCLEFLYR